MMEQSLHFSSNLSSVINRAIDFWIPVNERVINEILSKFYCGFYENSQEDLLEDLKKDIGIFLYSAKIFNYSEFNTKSSKFKNNNSELIISNNKLIPLLHGVKKKHSLNYANKKNIHTFQVEILNEALLSANVVSELSTSQHINCHSAVKS